MKPRQPPLSTQPARLHALSPFCILNPDMSCHCQSIQSSLPRRPGMPALTVAMVKGSMSSLANEGPI